MTLAIVLGLILIAAIVGAMKIARMPRYCHRCAGRIHGVPELEDKNGNCWHFECWQADRMRQFDAKIQESKLPRCVCGWSGPDGDAHYCIDGSLICPHCDSLLVRSAQASRS